MLPRICWIRSAFLPAALRPGGRLALLAALCVLALGGALGLEQGQGSAARGLQTSPLTSPLDSPVGTPTATATPTPTATSPLPPTLTPPANLETWPTPTPTPYPDPVEAALALVMEQTEVERADLEVVTRLTAVDPTDGTEFTAVQVRDTRTNRRVWLRGDIGGQAAFLPDFTDAALQLVAEQENAKPSDLTLSNATYAPYPFLGRVIWTGAVFNADSGKQSFVAFDLAGEPVDLTELSDAENAAKADACGAVEPRFCPQLFLAPEDEPIHVRAVLTTTQSLTETTTLLDGEGVTYQVEDLDILLAAPRDVVLALAHLDGVSTVREYFPDELLPLDTNLILGLAEESGQMWLTLESQEIYPLSNYRVEASLGRVEITTTKQITLAAVVEGVFTPASGSPSSRPALGKLALGELAGRYDLLLRYTNVDQGLDLADRYLLIVSDRRVVLRPSATQFSWPRYITWLRLPQDAIWFVVQARATDAKGQPFDVEPDAFADEAQAFYAAVEALGAEPLDLTEGVYINQGFIPPWPTWQLPVGDQVRIPVSPEKALHFRWPHIRYFRYQGDLDPVAETIDAFCQDPAAIVAYTVSGDVLDGCKP